ncbi:hypothetical protein UC41_28530, partial [Escherichia coli]
KINAADRDVIVNAWKAFDAEDMVLSGDEEETSKYKGGDDHDTVFSGGIAAGYDFYPQFSIPVRTELEFYARGKADSKYNVDKD